MQDEYLERIHPEVRGLVPELEKIAGNEIRVGLADDVLRNLPAGLRGDPLFQRMVRLIRLDNQAAISIPNAEAATTQALTHEVLHLKRAWMDLAPWPVPNPSLSPEIQQLVVEPAATIDNVLEHCFWLIPREKVLGVFDAGMWNRDYAEMLNLGRDNPPTEALRRFAALNWLAVTFLATDEKLRAGWRALLSEWGLLDEAESFVGAMTDTQDDKLAMIEHLPGHLEIARRYLGVAIYDQQSRRDVWRAL